MKSIRWGLLFAWAITAGVSAAPAGVDPLQRLVEQPSAWSTFDWSRNAKHEVFQSKSWSRLPDQKDTPITYERLLIAQGETWKASWWLALPNGTDVTLGISRDVPSDECSGLAQQFGKAFGQPIYSDETMGGPDKVMLNSKAWQWTIGTTRLTARCFGLTMSSDEKAPPSVLNISFRSAALAPVLEPVFLLRCSRLVHPFDGAHDFKFEDLVIWVFKERRTVMAPSRTVVASGDGVRINDDTIAFNLVKKEGSSRYAISRLTGDLTGETVAADGARWAISGTCAKENPVKKF